MYVTSLGVSLNSCNMIAPDRLLVIRFTCPSLGLRYILMWQWSQQEPAKPAIRIKLFSNSIFNVKKISPHATFCHFCSHFSLFLLDGTWNLLRGEIKKETKLVSGSLFLVPFFLSASAGGSTAKTALNSHNWARSPTGLSFISRQSLLSYSFRTFQTAYF